MKKIKYIVAALFGVSMLVTSCVDADLGDALDYDDAYTNVEDADKHILGVYSEFMDLAEQMVVLNELRGDLVTITANASDELQQVEAKVDNAGNPYLSATPYYKVINDINDCLDNFKQMVERHDMTEDEFNERYSDLAALRCYVYLQLAAQFGSVPYVTQPIVSVKDMEAVAAAGQLLSIDELLPRLIAEMESLPFMESYEESPLVINPVDNSAVSVDGQRLSYYFVPKKLILADLYLWNQQYREAAALYKEVMSYNNDAANVADNADYYKCASTSTATNGYSTVHNQYYQAFFLRYFDPDDNSFGTTWPEMFSDEMTGRVARYEWLWNITFTSKSATQYPFIRLFAPVADGGDYQLAPSEASIYNFARLDNLRTNGAPYDTRGDSATYVISPEGPVCEKYLYLYDPLTPTDKMGRWWLYRAAGLQLRFAEALNRAGYPREAWAFINMGIADYYGMSFPAQDDNEVATSRQSNPRDFAGQNGGHNLFHVLYPITMGVCDNETDSALLFFDPTYMDASANAFQGYYRRGPYRYHRGLRSGRACMVPQLSSDFSQNELSTCASKEDSIYLVEKIIMDEAALELAHEGQRFPDLVRVARRMNRTSTTTVNGKTYTLTNDGMDGNAYMREVLGRKASGNKNVLGLPTYSDENSWFLKLH